MQLNLVLKWSNRWWPVLKRSCRRVVFSVVFVCHSVHGGWGPFGHYPWGIGHYQTGTLWTWTSLYRDPPTSDIWWLSLETCSNLFTSGDYGWQAGDTHPTAALSCLKLFSKPCLLRTQISHRFTGRTNLTETRTRYSLCFRGKASKNPSGYGPHTWALRLKVSIRWRSSRWREETGRGGATGTNTWSETRNRCRMLWKRKKIAIWNRKLWKFNCLWQLGLVRTRRRRRRQSRFLFVIMNGLHDCKWEYLHLAMMTK